MQLALRSVGSPQSKFFSLSLSHSRSKFAASHRPRSKRSWVPNTRKEG
ncbi:hypothetical protein RchiOBHm_Chr6g0262531 [Rosa chinensis]|uniref:Uncharacterized protein n=1 Tax=Rosa chinensis TaxID=74649 RepID=A0A2P6PNM6_ROSCH|nr:hypothetical protein RchiOBHm_Chr6g0262531 [Rosa chinensis]